MVIINLFMAIEIVDFPIENGDFPHWKWWFSIDYNGY